MGTVRAICVCSGNICRSPMAVALLREKYQARGVSALVISAGTLGIQGHRAADFARAAITEFGPAFARHIDEHRSQGLSPALAEMADHIIVMSSRHEAEILRHNPARAPSIVRLWEHAPAEFGSLTKIPDPVGQGPEAFRTCRDLIDASLNHWLEEQ
jgi:protein-tyrosine phosphatase